MFARHLARVFLPLCLASTLIGCSTSGLDSIQVSPSSQSLAVGQTAQLSVMGTYGNAKHTTTQSVTAGLTWTSSASAVATVNASGLVTAVSAGTTTVTANATAFNGPVSSSTVITVTGSGGGSAGGNIASITIIPGSQVVSLPTQTSQFIAIGTTASGGTVNLTNQVIWSSSSPQIATIGTTTGLATAVNKGADTITALYTNPTGGSVVTGTATFTVTGGTSQQFTSLTITPNTQALSASGQTGQFVALGTSGTTGLQQDVTGSTQLKWSSSIPSVATVSPTGLVTGVSAGNTTITAVLTNSDGSVISNTANVAVSTTQAPEPLLSLTIIPSVLSVGDLQDTGQFLAIGTFSVPPYVRDLTNDPSVTWISSFPSVFPVNTNLAGNQGATAGIVTAYGNGSAAIIAKAKNPDGTIQTATATFNCPLVLPNPPTTPGSCFPGSQTPALLSTLTVYNLGSSTGNWVVTAPAASGTPGVIHCGPGSTSGGSVCVATYPILSPANVGTTVVLTETHPKGVTFGGWSYNCTANPVVPDPVGPNTCTVHLTDTNTNVTVGAIFN
ncbi:MAG: Ig-like domain-containing protein [Acidobacteria bacterium]|nr:Ig-like domain-containing protein [Acidobacteriota bacterium]